MDEATIREAADRLVKAFDAMNLSAEKVALAYELFGKDGLHALDRMRRLRQKFDQCTFSPPGDGTGFTIVPPGGVWFDTSAGRWPYGPIDNEGEPR